MLHHREINREIIAIPIGTATVTRLNELFANNVSPLLFSLSASDTGAKSQSSQAIKTFARVRFHRNCPRLKMSAKRERKRTEDSEVSFPECYHARATRNFPRSLLSVRFRCASRDILDSTRYLFQISALRKMHHS